VNSMRKKEVTINLEWPVEHEGKAINEVTMRRLKIGDRLKYPDGFGTRGDAENEITMIALMCDLPEEVICEMDQFQDYPKLSEAYLSFLGFPGLTSAEPAPLLPRKQKPASRTSKAGKRKS
jgi:hypothetical protein